MAYAIPVLALVACAALYIFESRAKKKSWVYGVAALALHIFAMVWFLLGGLGMELLLLFLLASLALAISFRPKGG